MLAQKNILKLTAVGLTLIFALLLIIPAQADKYGIDATVKATKGYLPTSLAGKKTVPEAVGAIVAVGLSLVGVMFFILALYAGFLWMTAMGNTEQVSKAKDSLEHAIIGIVIVVAAYAITSFVFSRLISGPAPAVTVSGCAPGGSSFNCKKGEACQSARDCEGSLKCDLGNTKTCIENK